MTLEEVIKKALAENADCLGGECDCVALGVARAVRDFVDNDEPVAWMYERGGPFPVRYIHDQRTPAYMEPVDHGFGITSGEWKETPLHARAALSSITGDE